MRTELGADTIIRAGDDVSYELDGNTVTGDVSGFIVNDVTGATDFVLVHDFNSNVERFLELKDIEQVNGVPYHHNKKEGENAHV